MDERTRAFYAKRNEIIDDYKRIRDVVDNALRAECTAKIKALRAEHESGKTYTLAEATAHPGGIAALTGGAITGPFYEVDGDDEPNNPQCSTDLGGESCCHDADHGGACEIAQDVQQRTVDAGGCER